MPQARLPDINTAFIVYRREVIISLKNQNYDNCFGALYALNGLLPDEYRIRISTKQYEEKTDLDIKVKCPKCDAETEYKKILVSPMLMVGLEGMIIDSPNEKVWTCTGCKQNIRVTQTEMIQPKLQEPFFVKTIPKPPMHQDGLHDRSTYHKKMTQWAWTFLDELEAQMAQFRDDNWHKGDEMYDGEGEIIDGGEDIENVGGVING